MSDPIKRELRTVADLEALVAELKASGAITSETPLAGIDVDGSTSGLAGVTAHVFNPTPAGIGDHMFAIWGNSRY